jgi:hypothetical protein
VFKRIKAPTLRRRRCRSCTPSHSTTDRKLLVTQYTFPFPKEWHCIPMFMKSTKVNETKHNFYTARINPNFWQTSFFEKNYEAVQGQKWPSKFKVTCKMKKESTLLPRSRYCGLDLYEQYNGFFQTVFQKVSSSWLLYSLTHSFCSLSDERSTVSFKINSPQSAIHCCHFQFTASSIFIKDIQ